MIVLWKKLDKCFDRNEWVTNLVGQTCAEQANGCELFGMLRLHGEMRALKCTLNDGSQLEQLRNLRISVAFRLLPTVSRLPAPVERSVACRC